MTQMTRVGLSRAFSWKVTFANSKILNIQRCFLLPVLKVFPFISIHPK